MLLAQLLFTFVLYGMGAALLAGALLPGLWLFWYFWTALDPQTIFAKALIPALCGGVGFFLFGLTLMAETVLLRIACGMKLRPGEYKLISAESFRWAFVNAMFMIVKFTFMDFIKGTPLLPFYFRLMGAKIGRGVIINTKDIGDISLIEIGDYSVIGGEAVVIAHLAEQGRLKLQKTCIGKKVTIGLGSVLMPGCTIGDGSVVAARSVLPKFTQVPPGVLIAGTPAKVMKPLEEKQ